MAKRPLEREQETESARAVDGAAHGDDAPFDRTLRPRTLADYVGQTKHKENLRVFVEAARRRGEPLDHILLSGPPGLGKTTLAHILAHEMGVQLVAIASSTGGPSALLSIFAKLPVTTTAGFVVAQHMPDKFTRTFAERLDKRGVVKTTEASDGDLVGQAMGFVCPGRKCMEVAKQGIEVKLRVGPAATTDRYVPSADKLFKSVAATGLKCVGVILTGMGDDGVDGARAIRDAGGIVIAESQETAVVNGMPGAAVRAGVASEVLPLPQIGEFLAKV